MSDAASPRTLPDGAIVRGARIDDVPAMMEIESDREGEDDAVDLELVANTPGGLASMSVVELDGRVVSIATLLDESVRVGGVVLPAGQVEMVATAKDAEGRGYVRALMERCHELSKARGHVLQVMIGIPNFYRQFGYSYSIPMHPWATVTPGTRVSRRVHRDDGDDGRHGHVPRAAGAAPETVRHRDAPQRRLLGVDPHPHVQQAGARPRRGRQPRRAGARLRRRRLGRHG